MTEPDRPRDRSGAWSNGPNSAAWDWATSEPGYTGKPLPEVTPRPEPDSVTLAAAVKAQTQAIRELTKAIRTLALAVATEPDDE